MRYAIFTLALLYGGMGVACQRPKASNKQGKVIQLDKKWLELAKQVQEQCEQGGKAYVVVVCEEDDKK